MTKRLNKNLKNLLLFLENDNVFEDDMLDGSKEMKYVSDLETEPENEIPETIIQDDADDEPEVSDTELESAIEYDNVHYGEFDKALEKK